MAEGTQEAPKGARTLARMMNTKAYKDQAAAKKKATIAMLGRMLELEENPAPIEGRMLSDWVTSSQNMAGSMILGEAHQDGLVQFGIDKDGKPSQKFYCLTPKGRAEFTSSMKRSSKKPTANANEE